MGLSACRWKRCLGTSADVVLSVDFDQRSHRVGKLIGWNVGAGSRYSPPGGPRHPEWRAPETTESLRRLSEVRPANGDRPVVRFGGLQIDGALGFDGRVAVILTSLRHDERHSEGSQHPPRQGLHRVGLYSNLQRGS